MTTWIKLCGLSKAEDIEIAVECKVQSVGFVFAESPRRITPEQAAELASALPANIQSVAVMLRPTQIDVDAILCDFMPDYVQADWQAMAKIELPDGVAALSVYRQGDGVFPMHTRPRFVYEGARSGLGETIDWNAAKPFTHERELILAGGLKPDNVGTAIRTIEPFGVDVSSGIESEPGVKDADLMRAFVAEVRAAEAMPQN